MNVGVFQKLPAIYRNCADKNIEIATLSPSSLNTLYSTVVVRVVPEVIKKARNSGSGLLSDRVLFKLAAAEHHLSNLKEINSKYGGIMGPRKLDAEMEIDCFFAQIIGAKDSLLVQINEKLGLAIPINDVCLDSVYEKLKSQKKEHLLNHLKKMASQKKCWFWLLNELRNHSIHRAMLSKRVNISIHENINTNTSHSNKPEVYFLNPLDNYKSPMAKSAIDYL